VSVPVTAIDKHIYELAICRLIAKTSARRFYTRPARIPEKEEIARNSRSAGGCWFERGSLKVHSRVEAISVPHARLIPRFPLGRDDLKEMETRNWINQRAASKISKTGLEARLVKTHESPGMSLSDDPCRGNRNRV
jgi:hypothetical protein